MLNKVKTLKKYTVNCLDGEIGKIKDIYFDDQTWAIRYLIMNTGNWLTGRQVLISPYSVTKIDIEEERIDVNLTKSQIENSPLLESDKPVSMQFQSEFHGYFEYPLYTTSMHNGSNWSVITDAPIEKDVDRFNENLVDENQGDPSLRSMNSVSGYGIQALDNTIGHVDDFFVDDDLWEIQYFEIDTKNLIPGRKVLISPNWIDYVSWNESKVFVNLNADDIKNSPEYNAESILNREYEASLYKHYNRNVYWIDRVEVVNSPIK